MGKTMGNNGVVVNSAYYLSEDNINSINKKLIFVKNIGNIICEIRFPRRPLAFERVFPYLV